MISKSRFYNTIIFIRTGFEDKKVLKSFVGDITKPETLAEAFEGVDCVIHTAAKTGFSKFAPVKELEEVNVNGLFSFYINVFYIVS